MEDRKMIKSEENNRLLNVLCLEDALNDAIIMKEILADAGYLVNMDITENEDEYLSLLSKKKYDVILSDYTIPGFNVHLALKQALEFQPDVPFICVSGTINADKAIEFLKEGIVDYVLKDRLTRLPYAVRQALESVARLKENRQAREELIKSESEFRLLAESMPQFVWITSADGLPTFFNQQWVDYTGLTHEESYGHGWNKPFHPDDQKHAWDAWQDATLNCTAYSLECRLRRYDGEYFWWLIRGVPVQDEHGKVLKWFGTCTDIHKLKLAEEELIKAKEHAEESDRLKTSFLANMSHEIRTPMNGILGFAELLKEPGLSGEEQQKYISIIEKSGARMLNIINDIISISKVESGLMEVSTSETNLNTLIEFILSFFKPEADQKGIEFFCKKLVSVNDTTVITDSEKVYAILSNLVKNALKFTKEGTIEIGYTKKEKEFEFFVKDTGVGILQEQKEFIFERFRQGSESLNRNYEGAGLGLTISKAYVEMLGGKIWVESDQGKGSIFYFTIPFASDEADQMIDKHSEPVKDEAPFKDLKILIVEDDENSEIFITMVVGSLGKNILNARNGLEAIDICRNNPDLDLILMDIKMPVMDGYEATRQIRLFNKEVIIISQTAFALTDDREKSLAAGCNDYLSKPLRKSVLIETIKKHFKNNSVSV